MLIEKSLQQVGLEGLYNRKINELSGGQKQRVAIARALVKNPRIILADEPTGNLDDATANEIFGILKELSKERLVIVVSHDRESAERYGDRIIELKDGEILVDKSIRQLNQVTELKNNSTEKAESNKDFLQNNETQNKKVIDTDKGSVKDKTQTNIKEIDTKLKILPVKNAKKFENDRIRKTKKISLGNMPFISAFNYAINNLWHKKFRVLTSIILFVISLAIFNCAYAASRYDVYKTTYNTFKSEGYKYVSLQGSDGNINKDYIQAKFGENATPIYVDNNIQITCGENYSEAGYYDSQIAYSMPIDSETVMRNDLNVLYGRLPNKSTEICVSKYKAENILHNNKNYWNSIGINTIDGLVNIAQDTYGIFTIVGIIDTKFPVKYDNLRDKSYDEIIQMHNNLSQSFIEQTTATPHVSVFCNEKYYEDFYVPLNLSFEFIMWANTSIPFNRKLYANPIKTLDALNINYIIAPNLYDGVVLTLTDAKEFIIRAGYENELSNYTYETITELLAKYDIRADMSSSQWGYNLNERIIGVFNSDEFRYKLFLSGSALSQIFDKINHIGAIVIDIDNQEALHRAIDCSRIGGGKIELNFNNDAADELSSATAYAEQFKLIDGVAAGIFAFIVVLLLLNYFMSTIKDKHREIGILRAIGVKNSNVLSIFILEAMIISITAFVFSLPLGYILTNWLESTVMGSLAMGYNVFVHFIDMGLVSCVVTFVLCMGIALIGCLAPFIKLFNRKPMELIRKQ